MPSSPDRRSDPTQPARLILASGSPRRRDLLTAWGVAFELLPANTPERPRDGESPEAMVLRLAREKAAAVAQGQSQDARCWVLGADTTVVLGNRVLGKPRDPQDAVEILTDLLGATHRVLTGVSLLDSRTGHEFSTVADTEVVMRAGSPEAIRDYVATGEPLDKAGAYAIQGKGRQFVETISGSETNVIGLPEEETLDLLRQAAEWEPST